MADDKKTLKFQMMMSPSEAETLDEWMFKHRIRSRAEAIRRLCQAGLEIEKPLVDNTAMAIGLLDTFIAANKGLSEVVDKSGEIPTELGEAIWKYKKLSLTASRQVLRQAGIVWAIFNSFVRPGDIQRIIKEAKNASDTLKSMEFGDIEDDRYDDVLKELFDIADDAERKGDD